MSRYSIISCIVAVAGVLAFGTQPGRADADVDGTDHSKLNHGVLGRAAHQEIASLQVSNENQRLASVDQDVAGVDHSKLNHGVLGTTWNSPSR
jgi:hypothetical protein